MLKKFKMLEKSQSAIEFIILVGFVLFFFVSFFLVINENISDKLREKKNLFIKDIALTVQDEIALASKASDGYAREFKIPQKIGNQDYDINITENMVYVRTQDNKYAIALPVASVSGEIMKGSNTIKKENGEVKLNE